jgi:precorrin-6A/cobalt-precorrin-6A reductase
MTRILILGGTTEASELANAIAKAGLDAVFSYAGRTDAPKAQPLPIRIGGFGGVPGLLTFLAANNISRVIDATHPFAAQMSRNAVVACTSARIPLLALERPAWAAQPGDHWTHVPDTQTAVAALPDRPSRVFLAIGKQTLADFAIKPQHHYILRLVDPPIGALPLPSATAVIGTGPFTVDGDIALLRDHSISHIVAKNAGGSGAEAKLVAARSLGLAVILIERPTLPPRMMARSVAEAMGWLHHASTERGV